MVAVRTLFQVRKETLLALDGISAVRFLSNLPVVRKATIDVPNTIQKVFPQPVECQLMYRKMYHKGKIHRKRLLFHKN